jgi:putative transposase
VSDDNVVKLIQPGSARWRAHVFDPGGRGGSSEFLAATADPRTDDGCRRVVRRGHLPEREIMTGIGPVAVRQPSVRQP